MTPKEGGAHLGLLEREAELGQLASAIDDCAAGRGGLLVIEGPAGIGKTSLLLESRRLGDEAGFRVVSARGAELEQGFPYGIVRQFFTSFLFTVDPEARQRWMRETAQMAARMAGGESEATTPADEFALLHSLYWMCVTIADQRPLMMVVDDAQWVDPPSLKYVEFSSRRIEQIPMMFVVATRPPDEGAPAPLVSLLADPLARLVRPGPLSLSGVHQLIRDRIDPAADVEFACACHEVTAGNPFFLGELVHEIGLEGLTASAVAADRVREIGPRGVSRVVLLRLRRLPESARRLASTLSVAGDGTSLRELSQLAGLSDAELAEAAAGLERADIVELGDGARFTHPILRAAIHGDLSVIERSALHRRAAELRRGAGSPDAEVAAHLLHVEPAGDPWVATALRAAAAQSEAGGDVGAAITLLERALRERAPDADQTDLLAQLGRCEARAGRPDGLAHLREALGLADDPMRLASIAAELANALKMSGRADEAADVLSGVLAGIDLPDASLKRRLQAELLGARFVSPAAAPRVRAAIDELRPPEGKPRDLLDRFLLAEAAFDAVAQLRPRDDVIRHGRPALAGGAVASDPVLGGQLVIVAGVALIWAEDFDFVQEQLTAALADARATGAVLALGNHSTMRAMCGYRHGRLLQAEADATTALQLADEVEGLQTLMPPAVAYAVLVGIERGGTPEDLRSLAFDPRLAAAAELLPFTQVAWARGELLLRTGDAKGALAAFRSCDRDDPGFGAGNPSMVPWREGAALALAHLGESEAAVELAAEAVRRARAFAAPRALGMALRAAALVGDAEERIGGLSEAVRVLEGSAGKLELVRARCDLGAALRAGRRRTEALAELKRARAAALELGAVALAARAAAELEAAGVRPRREPARGLAALTPSERRVAELAAEGNTNREIAQALFVTEKTVETHLGHVYDKLGVRSRRKLPGAIIVPTAA